MKEVTIRDLAKAANVSTATISRVINNQPGVSHMLRTRVLRLIGEMGYPLNVGHAPQTIGVVCSLALNIGRYQALLFNYLYRELKSRGYQVMIVSYEDLNLFNESIIKGVISTDFFQRISGKWPNLKNIPLVCINDSAYHMESIYSVQSDVEKAMIESVEHLLKLNHRRIGLLQYFEPHEESKNLNLDKDLFFKTVRKYGVEDTAFVETLVHGDSIHEVMGKLLLNDITALIVKGESFTPRVRRSLELYRKKVPEDISVIVNDDEYSCRYYDPAQTSMAYDFPELCRQAVNMLEGMMEGKPVSDVLVDYKFNDRGSTGPCPL